MLSSGWECVFLATVGQPDKLLFTRHLSEHLLQLPRLIELPCVQSAPVWAPFAFLHLLARARVFFSSEVLEW